MAKSVFDCPVEVCLVWGTSCHGFPSLLDSYEAEGGGAGLRLTLLQEGFKTHMQTTDIFIFHQ